MARQVAAVAAIVTKGRDPPAPSARLPNVAESVGIAAAPVAACPPPVCIPPMASGSSTLEAAAEEVERECGYTALTKFMKFHPPTFDGEVVDPWIVETWLATMETLFEDTYVLEQDKVHLAAHCLEKTVRVWWKRVKKDRSPNLSSIDWEEFRGLMFAEYFPDSDKRKMRKNFRKLKQVHAFKFCTFAEVLDRALWVEHGNACAREERETFEKDKGRKRLGGGSGGQSSFKKPVKYLKG
ncbi:uncharacterized protein LOC109719724 [Ananas comosus]|uniref:Uncharacterized protein LOC109719724 n=1 Tax=Ananas comosus TaxID=4615 RepID=A0A6P5G144_ANACO|nr:uncharacterized protein LOC109719724 [Ananas comosus]